MSTNWTRNKSKLKVGIVGFGFVGGAVSYGFKSDSVEQMIIDPKLGHAELEHLGPFEPDIVFICTPTPMGKDGSIDASICTSVIAEIRETEHLCPIVVKSTVTPDVLREWNEKEGYNIIYNPEFLTEKNANEDFINPKMHVFGGQRNQTELVQAYYEEHSLCRPCPVYHMTAEEASLVKYGINCFLATKVLWFNQFYDVVSENVSNFNKVIAAIGGDPRIGRSHTLVPGFDGKRGYGGACFPKDTAAFSAPSEHLSVLQKVIFENNKYRRQYNLDAREVEQNVDYEVC